MADEPTGQEEIVPDAPPVTPPAGTGVKSDPQDNPLYPRVQELSQKNKALQEQVTASEAQDKAREEAEAKKRGDHDKIIESQKTEIADLKPKGEAYDQLNQSRREALKSELPEQFHAQLDSWSPLDLAGLEAFATNIKTLAAAPKGTPLSGFPVGTPPSEPPEDIADMTDKERREGHEARMAHYASKSGVTPIQSVPAPAVSE